MDTELRETVRVRTANRCEYCRLPHFAQLMPFHVEHIIAKQHGGNSDLDNLAWSCDRCNAFKGPNLTSVDPQTGQFVPLFHPRHDIWQLHFALDSATILGLTPIGRATVRLLQMNAKRRVDVRRELIEEGIFD